MMAVFHNSDKLYQQNRAASSSSSSSSLNKEQLKLKMKIWEFNKIMLKIS